MWKYDVNSILLSLKSVETLFVPVQCTLSCMAEMKAYVIYILKWKEKLLEYAIILYTYNYFGTLKKEKKIRLKCNSKID